MPPGVFLRGGDPVERPEVLISEPHARQCPLPSDATSHVGISARAGQERLPIQKPDAIAAYFSFVLAPTNHVCRDRFLTGGALWGSTR
jgi:hypothetical protein